MMLDLKGQEKFFWGGRPCASFFLSSKFKVIAIFGECYYLCFVLNFRILSDEKILVYGFVGGFVCWGKFLCQNY